MKKACPSLVLIPALKRECSSGPASISDPDPELRVINSTDLRGSPEQIIDTTKIIEVIRALSHVALQVINMRSVRAVI